MKQKRRFLYIVLAITLCIGFLFPTHSLMAASDIQRVWDYTDSLSQEQIQTLEEEAETRYSQTGYNYLIVITDTLQEYDYEQTGQCERDCERYSEAFYSSFLTENGSKFADCAILTLDINPNIRYADISGQGSLKSTYLNSDRCTSASKRLVEDFSEDNWYNGCLTFYKTLDRYIKIKPGIDPESIFLKTWFQLILAVAISAIIILINALHLGGKMTVSQRTYLDETKSRLIGKHDHYIRTSVHKTKRSSSSGGSGGSGGGGGGGSHGGSHF